MESGIKLWMKRLSVFARYVGRSIRLLTINRDIFGFLIFLCIAIAFWFAQTFKDRTTASIDYELKMVNVPRNIIFTSEVPKNISVTLSGRGFSILQYVMQKTKRQIKVDYADLVKVGGVVTIDNYIWRKALSKELPADITFAAVTPSTVEIYYSHGDHKQVPVVFGGKIRTTEQHILCGLDIKPQYVDIYAPLPQFDTIQAVYTQPIVMNELADTLTMQVALQNITGVKMVPDSVSIQACVDLLTSKTLKVPIYCENIPTNKTLRTFPLMAEVSFQVSATMFNQIMPDNFIIVVDYKSIGASDTKCRLQTRQIPEGIYNLKVSPAMVDYVIEQEE